VNVELVVVGVVLSVVKLTEASLDMLPIISMLIMTVCVLTASSMKDTGEPTVAFIW